MAERTNSENGELTERTLRIRVKRIETIDKRINARTAQN